MSKRIWEKLTLLLCAGALGTMLYWLARAHA